MDTMKVARAVVHAIYPEHCTYDAMKHLANRWGSCRVRGAKISCGMFRSVIIPNHRDFIIKTGLSAGGNNQCEREMNIYEDALNAGLSSYFAKCYGKFRYHNHWFYVFERVDDIDECRDEFCPDDPELEDFLSSHSINDLHGGNYGIVDGSEVLTDYAGYRWEDKDW